ncbi:MAG: carbon-nitrogen hydrolase family protein [Clostridia bacterium]|nr:carbon-nitrogen hydrolase family protein [Clostridia bacterium]
MSNYVKISCVGPKAIEIDVTLPLDQAVDEMADHLETRISMVTPDQPDLIVLPEACDRPSNFPVELRKRYYEERKDRILDRLSAIALKNRCYIAYSAAVKMEDGSYRNATRLIGRDGKIAGTYHKNHVVVEETTKGDILCGKQANVIDCDFGKVACVICFDLNFDEIRETYKKQKPDLILFSSVYHGGLMQSYWAYSLRAHFAGAVAGLPCTVLSPSGSLLASSTNYFDFVTATINLDCELIHLDYNRDQFPAIKEKYGSKVTISDPGFLGAVIISSETEEFTVGKIIDEYNLELLDDYFERALTHRKNNMED